VVPSAGDSKAEIAVGAMREHPAAEAGDHRREVEGRPHAIDVHVLDAGLDVPTAPPHLVEAEGLDLHGLGAAAGDGVHAHLEMGAAVEVPDLMAVLGLDDLGRTVL